MIYWILGIILIIALAIIIPGYHYSAPAYQGPVSDHFNGKTFFNKNGASTKNFLDIIKWSVSRNEGEWSNETTQNPTQVIPAHVVDDSIQVTFINHASFLIQTDSLNIITDPIYSKRASPVSFAGPLRMRNPGISFKDLPKIDIVLISHNHYDHLDLATLKQINETSEPVFVTPLGVDLFLHKNGIKNTVALDWWQGHKEKNLMISCVPAQHFSSRGLFDKNKTLWAGFMINSVHGNIYFAGDTGYGEFIKEISKRNKVKLALLPIGAYEPRWVMGDIHMDPQEALKAFKDLNAETGIGMHFGTFPMADDGQYESAREIDTLLQMPENAGLNFRVIKEGETVTVKN